jgi:hypothetical protein
MTEPLTRLGIKAVSINSFTVNIREARLSPKVHIFDGQPPNPRFSGFATSKTDVLGIPPPSPRLCRETRKYMRIRDANSREFGSFFHKNCSNDENISKKAIANYCDSSKPEKIPEFTQILVNSHHEFARNRPNSPDFSRILANL